MRMSRKSFARLFLVQAAPVRVMKIGAVGRRLSGRVAT